MKSILLNIEARIRKAAIEANRDPESVRLVAVSKTKPIELVRKAIEAGANIIGENYVQEARDKFTALGALSASWHFIGHLQSNKAKYAVRIFDLIHTVDSLNLAAELNRQAAKINKIQDILIQVNIAEEDSKSGVSPSGAPSLIEAIAPLAHVRIKGLMCIPPFFDAPQKAQPYFRALRLLRDELEQKNNPNVTLTELSMGMTGDFEVAIAEGATLVRIGTALFGRRE
ncbi:MAG: YggS family pyridoxal phosphate-dependent enzyme [Desulfobacterales bacterium]|nr:YggS family pyridoxal phosphate-dependent enzyme [Desulfobacterales bacterium]